MFDRLKTSKAKFLLAILGVTSVVAIAIVAVLATVWCGAPDGNCFGTRPYGPSVYIVMDHYSIETVPGQQVPTNLTVWLKSTGSSTAVVSSLKIQDASTSSSPIVFPLSVSILPNTLGVVSVDTSMSGLYFTTGHQYSLNFLTSTNNGFTYVITY